MWLQLIGTNSTNQCWCLMCNDHIQNPTCKEHPACHISKHATLLDITQQKIKKRASHSCMSKNSWVSFFVGEKHNKISSSWHSHSLHDCQDLKLILYPHNEEIKFTIILLWFLSSICISWFLSNCWCEWCNHWHVDFLTCDRWWYWPTLQFTSSSQYVCDRRHII